MSEIEIQQPYPVKLFNAMNKNKHNVPLPNISADAWCVLDMDSGGQLLFGKRANHKREIASLTKMMTFYVAW
jgi:D-alanyl-D-alanine carboxypeptidase